MSLRLIDIGETRVVTIGHSDSTDKAMALMEENDIHHLPVISGTEAVGMISDRDLLLSVGWLARRDRFASGQEPGYVGPTRVSEIMSNPVKALSGDARPEEAIRLMLAEKIHALPLMYHERLAGIVTKLDLLKLYLDDRYQIVSRSSFRLAKVRDHMRARVFSMKPNDTISCAVKLMHEKHIRHLPILDDDKLVGIVSDRDIRLVLGQAAVDAAASGDPWSTHRYDTRLVEIMSVNTSTAESSTTLAEVADHMIAQRVGTLPVVSDEQVIGIITETDLLRALAAAHD